MTTPWSFHMESMMSMEQWIGCGPSQHSFHGFHMELLMDSIWINPGKVKTSNILIFIGSILLFSSNKTVAIHQPILYWNWEISYSRFIYALWAFISNFHVVFVVHTSVETNLSILVPLILSAKKMNDPIKIRIFYADNILKKWQILVHIAACIMFSSYLSEFKSIFVLVI